MSNFIVDIQRFIFLLIYSISSKIRSSYLTFAREINLDFVMWGMPPNVLAMNSCRLWSSFLSGFTRLEMDYKCWIYNCPAIIYELS